MLRPWNLLMGCGFQQGEKAEMNDPAKSNDIASEYVVNDFSGATMNVVKDTITPKGLSVTSDYDTYYLAADFTIE